MGLPIGFQPRPCLFCGCRILLNGKAKDESRFQVTCMFCGASGPLGESYDNAWLAWNGDCMKAPSMFGAQQEAF